MGYWHETITFTGEGFFDLPTRDVDLSAHPEVRSWEELCALVGASTQALFCRAHVSPMVVSTGIYHLETRHEKEVFAKLRGSARFSATVHVDGRADVTLLTPFHDDLIDGVIMKDAESVRWLPALRMGRPIEETVTFTILFDDSHRSGLRIAAARPVRAPTPTAPTAEPAPRDDGPPKVGEPPISRPGGEGEAPTGTPGGAGHRPGDPTF